MHVHDNTFSMSWTEANNDASFLIQSVIQIISWIEDEDRFEDYHNRLKGKTSKCICGTEISYASSISGLNSCEAMNKATCRTIKNKAIFSSLDEMEQ